MNFQNNINEIDKKLSAKIANFFTGKLKNIPFYLGLLPYELYVFPGMFVALFQIIWYSSFDVIQFHIIPHLLAYSLFTLLKRYVKRPRPGCFNKKDYPNINKSHCTKSKKMQSFPSGHTGVAFSLLAALALEITYGSGKFFGLEISKGWPQLLLIGTGGFISIMTAIQRVSGGYHTLFDVIFGSILGISIGSMSWIVTESSTIKFNNYCTKNSKNKICINKNKNLLNKDLTPKEKVFVNGLKVIWSIIIFFLSWKFFTVDLKDLKAIHH